MWLMGVPNLGCVLERFGTSTRKEQVIGENWDADIAIPMPTTTIFARSILWKNLGTNGLAIDAAEH